MIAQLTGKFMHKTPTRLVVDVHGVGYEVNISLNTFSAIQSQEAGTLYIFLKIAEDAHTLYGFAEPAEKEIFLHLISVSGVGAGTARMMLSSMKPAEVQRAIVQANVKLLESIKGIGKKTAERIVLELKDKLGKQAAIPAISVSAHNTTEADALEALVALGINRQMAENAMRKALAADPGIQSVEALIKLVLKSL